MSIKFSLINMAKPRLLAAATLCAAIAGGMPLGMAQLAQSAPPEPVAPDVTAEPPPSVEKFSTMFSDEIQNTVGACAERGMVDLAAGESPNGEVICADGEPQEGVSYVAYLGTVSDILAASSLVGFQTALTSDPRLSPELFATFITSPQGMGTLRSIVEMAINQSQLVSVGAAGSNTVLTDEVVEKVLPRLSQPQQLGTLFGNDEQYGAVVQTFCTPPGNSPDAVIQQVGVDSLQLYAICLQEAGVVADIQRMLN
jgi:hypothetical protein